MLLASYLQNLYICSANCSNNFRRFYEASSKPCSDVHDCVDGMECGLHELYLLCQLPAMSHYPSRQFGDTKMFFRFLLLELCSVRICVQAEISQFLIAPIPNLKRSRSSTPKINFQAPKSYFLKYI